MIKILLLADSLALPNKKENIGSEETYVSLVMNKYQHFEIKQLSEMGNDTEQTLKLLTDKVIGLRPKFAIIQLGITDCAPRVFRRNELNLILKFPSLIQDLIQYFASKFRYKITKLRKIQYVPISRFKINYEAIINRLQKVNTKICLINIVHASDDLCSFSHGMRENVIHYNTIINQYSQKYSCYLVNLNKLTLEDRTLVANDGYHISIEGNRLLYKEINRFLSSEID